MTMLLQRLGLLFFGNVLIVLSVLGYEKSIADTMMYIADATTGSWQPMAVSIVCLIAGNILIITGVKMSTKKNTVAPTMLSDSLPNKMD